MKLRRIWQYMRTGWLTVTVFYLGLLGLSWVVYRYAQRLPNVQPAVWQGQISLYKGLPAVWEGLGRVWLMFAWGFGVQFLVQLSWILRRQPKAGSMAFLWKRGAWLSLHAGVFEELIFRYYAYLSFVLGLVWLNQRLGGGLGRAVTAWVLPFLNVVTAGYFAHQFDAAHWALGLGAVIGASFFRSAHLHYGKFSRANVWTIGVVMFWLTFNYGLLAAIVAHSLYDLCVFSAIALASPFQPRARAAE